MARHFDQAPGLCEQPDTETRDYVLNHTMVRIKDPAVSLDFYTRALGMRLIRRLDFEEMEFSLYFLGYLDESRDGDVPSDAAKRTTYTFSRESLLELTHNWGDESRSELQFHNGNDEPKGYGHIGINVPDVYQAAERLESLGVEFVKKPNDGKMKGIAFIKDPDGYWIEILQADQLEQQGMG